MKTHSTIYFDTFIEVSEDCQASSGIVPPGKYGKPTVAYLQYEMLVRSPYRFTSDEILFSVFAVRNGVVDTELEVQRQAFFFKGQPCFRASPLSENYGWGVHSDTGGKIALYVVETHQYQKLLADVSLKKLKAMRTKRK